MNQFLIEDWKCAECKFEGEPEKTFENLWGRYEEVIYICPVCGYSIITYSRVDDEEFYY